ncbi:hypothetical protein SSBR45G_54300 [Bradyrhizobium sp. SSBR45G]|uniref:hypothetical protein n=1 Tax=unclassified Bradyrhizobium TaxID=2631580 RepID=UPI002342AA14|nr:MULTISPECIES: hypothetical protein [unclassified Bradyrhizobium]GLH80521.1 hypothetical protein SSBR45G_54300 [Bradyrhizobium sp. SSBR45G]GLH87916.1 hypothetical protein SSBR45R_53760 [Bradyrhizobium sp. SSBR45R]
MTSRSSAILLCSAIGLCCIGSAARAEVLAHYECSIIGPAVPEPIGDRPGHTLATVQFSCFAVDGAIKGAVYTAVNVAEWDGTKGTYQFAGGVHRIAGGFAVTQLSEGHATVVIRDGQPVGTEGTGKAVIKYAAGTLAQLDGKALAFVTKTTGLGRFNLDFTD